MSTPKSTAADYAHVTPANVERIRAVLAQVTDRHEYSASGLYDMDNLVFKTADKQQNCSSCLIARASRLSEWLTNYDAANLVKGSKAPKMAAVPEVTFQDVIGKYALAIGDTPGEQLATIDTVLALNDLGMTTAELALVADAYNVIGGSPYPGAIALGSDAKPEGATVSLLIQKVNKETNVAEGDVIAVTFTPGSEDPLKGTLINDATGKGVGAGTYVDADGRTIAVQVGAKATIAIDLT